VSLPRLIVLTDRHQIPAGQSLERRLEACVAAGLEAVVVRELDLEPAERDALVTRVAGIVPTVITAHRPHPAAHGVHVSAAQAPRNGWWGRSCHSRMEVQRAAAEGAAWAMLGPFAASVSKPGYGPPLDPSEFALAPLPVYALGGVDGGNAAAAVAAGAHGVAVMGTVMRSAQPEETIHALLTAIAA
jgi:thiamine-phosphate pyrophosphorylase